MSCSIRITYVIPTLDQSGAERQLTLLATHLPQDEFQVNVIALNRGGYYADQLRAADVPVEILEKRFRFDPLTYVRLRRSLGSTRPDVVQSFLFSANSYVRLPGICPPQSKIVVSERCVDSWKSGWQLKLDGWLSHRMHAMTANSVSVAEFYRKTVGVEDEFLHVIPNAGGPQPMRASARSFQSMDGPDAEATGTDTNVGGPSTSTAALNSAPASDIREEFGISPDARLVGFVGRLAPQKCLRDLVWAFQLLCQVIENVFLVIVGDGPERDALAEVARSFGCRDRVIFTGHRQDAANVISQLNVFCLPSSFEGMSNSLMEAMASGVAVVVSDIPANLELVRNDENGLTFPVGDGPEIMRACARLLDNPDVADRVGLAAQQTILENHSVGQLVQKHVDLYRRLTQ